MTRIAGVLVLVAALYAFLYASNPAAFEAPGTVIDLLNRHGYYGVLTLGVAVVIITGGIDLSIGSVVALAAVGFGVLMKKGVHPAPAVAAVLAGGAAIGLLHGLLVTRARLQSFLVTLCGLFVYRGLARALSGVGEQTEEQNIGLGTIKGLHPAVVDAINSAQWLLVGKWYGPVAAGERVGLLFPMEFVLMLLIAAALAVVLHASAYGRYWYAVGHNEQAARYSGVNADRQRVVVFVMSSTLAALGGVLLLLDFGTVDAASDGAEFELLAITGAVLGGCSLRGGEGTVLGVVLGAAVLPAIKKLNIYLGVPNTFIPVVIGVTLLLGTAVDEVLRRRAKRAG